MGKRLLCPPLQYPPEDALFRRGLRYLAGIDEAGRGPLAGPVVAAAVILPEHHPLADVRDSKELSQSAREKMFERIRAHALACGFGVVDQWEIDRINIHQATLKAMEIAVGNLHHPLEHLLIDGLYPIRSSIPQTTIVDGDRISRLIGAASILAKVIRDRIMEKYHELYPWYNFARNKGYGTREHLEMLRLHGYCALHRKTFRGVLGEVKRET
jgi:ribonuclease HII